jgi:hypothetical protein
VPAETFEQIIAKHRSRMTEVREAFERDGRVHGISKRDPTYSLLLTRNGSSDAPFRVMSFRNKEPVGHREYDRVQGGGPTHNAFQEFASDDIRLIPRPTAAQFRDALQAIVAWQSDCLNYGREPTARSQPTDDDLCELFNRIDRARKILYPTP